VSTLTTVFPLVSLALTPGPAIRFFVPSTARKSCPPAVSSDPLVTDHVPIGTESGGNEVTPDCAAHPLHNTITLCPTVSIPLLETYTYSTPVLLPDTVAVAPAVIVNTVLPKRTLQGMDAEQLAPIVRILLEVRFTCKSPS
jgi:hypothetical protein